MDTPTDDAPGSSVPVEDTPLLGAPAEDDDATRRRNADALFRHGVVLANFAVIFLIELGDRMIAAPLNAIMEDNICHQLNPQLDAFAGDPLCKAPDVQGRLAFIRGWTYAFDAMPGILFAVPYGLLSDKWGRRPVMALSIFGIVLSLAWYYVVLLFPTVFPIWTVWFNALFSIIGGSSTVTIAMIYTSIADVVPVTGRATAFFQLNSVFLVAELAANPLSGLLMGSNGDHPWLPMFIGFAMIVLCNVASLLLPETIEFRKLAISRQDGQSQADEEADPTPSKQGIWQKSLHIVKDNASQVWTFILCNKSLAVLMSCTVFVVVGKFVSEVLLQYMTKRYNWSWRKAAFLLSVRSASNLVAFLVILPAISFYLTNKLNMDSIRKDLLLARLSGTILVVGTLLIAFAVNPYILTIGLVVFSIGQGFAALVRSLLNAIVEPHHVGVLNAFLGILSTVGVVAGGPILMGALRKGIELGGPWIGLPFMIAAASFATATWIVVAFRVPRAAGSPL